VKAKEQTCLFQDLSGTKYYITSTNIKPFILKLFVSAILSRDNEKRFENQLYMARNEYNKILVNQNRL